MKMEVDDLEVQVQHLLCTFPPLASPLWFQAEQLSERTRLSTPGLLLARYRS